MSEVLPIFRAYYFSACSDLSLSYEAYDFSSQSRVLGVSSSALQSHGRQAAS